MNEIANNDGRESLQARLFINDILFGQQLNE